jgi:hypothetical protein
MAGRWELFGKGTCLDLEFIDWRMTRVTRKGLKGGWSLERWPRLNVRITEWRRDRRFGSSFEMGK